MTTSAYAKPGFWPDMDMLEVGHAGLSMGEQTVHFVMWSILKSPLLLGNDLRNMSPDVKALLTNREIIAVNQDSLGQAAKRVAKTPCTAGLTDSMTYGVPKPSEDLQATSVYVGELSGGRYVVALLNGCAQEQRMRLPDSHVPKGSWSVRDIINGKDLGTASTSAGLAVKSAGSAAAKIGTGSSLFVSDVGGHNIVALVLSPGKGTSNASLSVDKSATNTSLLQVSAPTAKDAVNATPAAAPTMAGRNNVSQSLALTPAVKPATNSTSRSLLQISVGKTPKKTGRSSGPRRRTDNTLCARRRQ